MSKICDDYIDFLSKCKTERKCVAYITKELEKNGFKNINDVKTLKSGDKVYINKMSKALVALKIGTDDIENGMNILGAHIDSPRLDIKSNPLYEQDGLVYLNTHYYGGIKKYQWTAIPLSLEGVVFLKNGKSVEISIGDNDDDPVFCITDILPHLAYEQMKKTASEFIEAELLDVLVGSPSIEYAKNKDNKKDTDTEKDINKKNILKLLKTKYNIDEEDFLSSEIEVVPQGKARYSGFDKSMILGYGQDDRVCAYSSFRAFLDSKNTKRTSCLILSDKEEIGSYGATGMDSCLLDNAISDVVYLLGKKDTNIATRHTLSSSYMLSSDVNAAFDPLNPALYDKQNASKFAGGLVFNKYTGSRGKSGASDANPEFIALVRNRLDSDNIKYQFAELGKVEAGGGGTIALYAARFGMQVIDAGVSVLSMHAPWEIVSSYDFEEAYKGYYSFLQI